MLRDSFPRLSPRGAALLGASVIVALSAWLSPLCNRFVGRYVARVEIDVAELRERLVAVRAARLAGPVELSDAALLLESSVERVLDGLDAEKAVRSEDEGSWSGASVLRSMEYGL
ncbi:hypothetical protein GCM10010988_22290 [Cnuibacter physcomitrellae]|nr:hypothetical protein [Cnuibacter physcomitrellae]GGI39082.1 hypothetical protein GCM10010988_22290 [Cnuibacter physcomitrellae]